MKIKIKPIDKAYWHRVLKKKTAWVQVEERSGVAYIIELKEVTAPLVKNCFGQDVVLADVGYYWLQIGLENENVWITAMYNEKGEFVQYYFDATRKNVIDGEKSYFEDLFLDVIVQGENEIEVLDEDELKMARKEKNISRKEYKLAIKQKKQIIRYILKNRENCDRMCRKYFEILRNKLAGEN